MFELETERLRLRALRESDLQGMYELHSDALSKSVYRTGFERGDIWRRIATALGHWQLRGYGPWALEDKNSGAYVGACSLWFPEGWHDVEVGYSIHPAFRGRGLAVEAAICVRNFGFSHYKFKRLVSYIQPSNLQSIRVAEKLGATVDGDFMMGDIPHTIYLHQH